MSNEEELEKTAAEEQPAADAVTADEQPAADAAPAEEQPAPAEDSVQDEPAKDEADELSDEQPDKPAAKKAEKPVKAKAKKAKPARKGMSKLFKLVYFPVLALFAVFMMVFSVIDGVYGYKPAAYDDGYYTAVKTHIQRLSADTHSAMSQAGISVSRDYIVSALKAGKFTEVTEELKGDDDNSAEDTEITTVTEWAKDSSKISIPTVTVMTSKPSGKLQTDMGGEQYLVGYNVTNVIAAIPSVTTQNNDRPDSQGATAGAVVITVRYDARPDTYGASNAAFVATAIQSLCDYVANATQFENDLIVVFTEEMGNSIGSYAFFESFKGLTGVTDRVKLGLNLDAYGNGGTLALTDASAAGYSYVKAYSKVSGNAFNSSFVPDAIPDNYGVSGAVKAFGDIPALQVAVLGGLDVAGSLANTADNVSDAIIHQQSDMFKSYVDGFAVKNTQVAADSSKDITYFSYFESTAVYTHVAAYVIGAIILAMIAGVIVMLVLKKTFSLKRLFIALGVEVGVLASVIAVMYAAYFLITLMLTGFGVLPIHAITQVRYFNAGILIAAMFISLAAVFGFTSLYKKLFKVMSSDVVRGTALLFGLVGAIMSFAAPAYSYLTAWAGLFLTAVLLVTVLFNGKFKQSFGVGFDRLFVFVIPMIFCMPIMLAGLSAMTELLPLVLLPVTISLFAAMLGVIAPYLDRTVTVFDKVAKKLPKRTQRVQRVVTERVEDRAKKGKFTEVQVKRVEKEKVAVNYKNYFGISLLAVLGIVIALFSGGFGATMGQTIVPLQSYDNAVYNDSMVYVWERDGSGNVTQKIVVDDLIAYKYVRYAVNDLEWDAENSQYYKTVYYNNNMIIDTQPSASRNGKTYTVTTFEGARSTVKLTIPYASKVTKITVKNGEGSKEYEYKFDNVSTITLVLPYGFAVNDKILLDIEGATPSTIEYESHREVLPSDQTNMLDSVDEWNAMLVQYKGQDVLDHFRGAIVAKAKLTV